MSNTPKTLTREECNRLLAAFDTNETLSSSGLKMLRNRLIVLLLLDAGLRVGELVNLQQQDLYINNATVKTLLVRKEISKSKHERTVPLSMRTIATADRYLRNNSYLQNANYNPYLFENWKKTGHITSRQVERIIAGAAIEWIGRPVYPHMLRHTCGTNLMRVTNARIVQEILGHKHLSSTQIYTHPNDEDKKKAIEFMSSSLADDSLVGPK